MDTSFVPQERCLYIFGEVMCSGGEQRKLSSPSLLFPLALFHRHTALNTGVVPTYRVSDQIDNTVFIVIIFSSNINNNNNNY